MFADFRYENAAQMIGIILTNHRFLEKLDVLDVQTLILEILTRVDHHIDNEAPLGVVLHALAWLTIESISKSYLAAWV